MDRKQKYVRLKRYNEIIIFPEVIQHSKFEYFDVVSAGFCYVNPETKTVDCFGESISLRLKSNPIEDTEYATMQIFGYEAYDNLIVSRKNE